jgi:pimeloyl-ACP methyl ester carboxylesterase
MKPFRLEVPGGALADLRERLKRTRFPDEPPAHGWTTGTNLSYLRDLVHYWQTDFDWRAQEARINAFPQFKAPIDGVDIHFIHVRREGKMPLLLAHGWPGSVVEFLALIPQLSDFSLVVPSLPGYTLSFTPGQKRYGVEEIADCFVKLMVQVLGYRRFGLQGGDWGAFISSRIAAMRPELVAGLHLNYLPVRRDGPIDDPDWQAQLNDWVKERSGYSTIQGTRPQTLAYGLTDSPAGLAAWIAEKFRDWSDAEIDRDAMLANISLYWFTGAIGSSFWPYYARLHGAWPVPGTVNVPTAYASFPKEILRPPRAVAERMYTNIRRWAVMPKGGHFAALEQPGVLAADITAFFASL